MYFFYQLAQPVTPPNVTSISHVVETLTTHLECRWNPILNETVRYTWLDNNNTAIYSEMEGTVSVDRFVKVSRYQAGSYVCNVSTAGGSITGAPVQMVVHCKYLNIDAYQGELLAIFGIIVFSIICFYFNPKFPKNVLDFFASTDHNCVKSNYNIHSEMRNNIDIR